jgi:membrane protease YdiL (CAAX protease family)
VSDMVLGVVLIVVSLLAIGIAASAVNAAASLDDEGERILLAAATATFELALAGSVLLLAARRGVTLRSIGFRLPRRWGPLWVAWGGSYVILFTYTAVLVLIDGFGFDTSRFTEGNELPVDATDGGLALLILGISVVGLAPFCEEIFFRGLLARGLRGYWKQAPALLLSGVLFGLFHQNISVVVPFSLIGILFGWANEESGSIWTSVAAHGAVNALSFAITTSGAVS